MKRAVLLCVVAAWSLLNGPLHATTRILIFPFEADNSVPHWEWLSYGLPAEIELRLLRVSSADVALHDQRVPDSKVEKVARSHGARAYVTGSFRIAGGFVEVEAVVVKLSAPDMPRKFSGRAPFSSMLRSLDDLCKSMPVATGARLLRTEHGYLDHPTTDDVEAFEFYASGLAHLRAYQADPFASEDHLVPALISMMRARKKDKGFYGPCLKMGRIHEQSGNSDRSIASYREAIRRAPGLKPAMEAIARMEGKPSL